jgi:hypothetical protein
MTWAADITDTMAHLYSFGSPTVCRCVGNFKMKTRLALAITFVLLLLGCHSSTLTRGKAKNVIESSDLYKLQKARVALTSGEFQNLWRAGYLQVRMVMFQQQLEVGPKGKGLIDSGNLWPGGTNPSIVLAAPLKPYVLDVTGITDGETGSKIVEYKWNWDFSTQPKELQDFFKNHPVGEEKATLRLYDDGWRAEWKK